MNHLRITKETGTIEEIVKVGNVTYVNIISVEFALQIKANFKHEVIYDDDDIMLVKYIVED